MRQAIQGLFWLVGRALILPVRVYQLVCRPIMPPLCRFVPSCSDFMIQAITKRGPVWGVILGTWRICRCNPLGGFGYDPVENYPPYFTGSRWVWKRPANYSCHPPNSLSSHLTDNHSPLSGG